MATEFQAKEVLKMNLFQLLEQKESVVLYKAQEYGILSRNGGNEMDFTHSADSTTTTAATSKSSDEKRKQCSHCKRTGHVEKDCWAKRGRLGQTKTGGNAKPDNGGTARLRSLRLRQPQLRELGPASGVVKKVTW